MRCACGRGIPATVQKGSLLKSQVIRCTVCGSQITPTAVMVWVQAHDATTRAAMPPATALARTTDPATAKAAAHYAADKLGQDQVRAAEAVRLYPGKTAVELAQLVGDGDPRRINRRLGEIDGKQVRRGDARRCAITQRAAATWWPQ